MVRHSPATGQSDVQAAGVVEKPDPLVIVSSHAGQDNVVLLTSLECINTSYLHLLVEFHIEGTTVLHVGHDECPLTFVRGDYADLLGFNPAAKERRGQLLHVGCFGSVDKSRMRGKIVPELHQIRRGPNKYICISADNTDAMR